MNQNIEIALKQAFNLIEAEKLDDARAILHPILETEKDNPDVWWVYAHAVTDKETARLALNNVLRLDPTYPEARELFTQLDSQSVVDGFEDLGDSQHDPSFVPSLPTTVPGIAPLPKIRPIAPQTDPDFGDDDLELEADEAFYRRPLFYVPLISLLVIVALAIVIFKPFSVSSPTIPTTIDTTSQALVPTPTEEVFLTATTSDAEPTESTATATLDSEPTAAETPNGNTGAADFADVIAALSNFSLSTENAVTIEPTSLGRTLTAAICTVGGREMRTALPQVTVALANAAGAYSESADAIAIKMLDCANNNTLLQVGTPIANASGYASGTVTEQQFQGSWKPI
ncbi:MAG: hypothetical protein IT321_00645 [Anaerolineae bacterium]|nr:hypothetical protein [Anaerolineae bacterium]